MTEACDLSARDARRMMGDGVLSPVELFDSCHRRIEQVNPAVNAIVAERYQDARKEAEAAEAAIQQGDPLPLLHGLPIGVKDTNEVGGLRSTYGSLIYSNNIPKQDEGLVKAVRGNGAIVMGKTNTPEFTAGANTVNLVYGVTRNPFDTELTCGGSSGGCHWRWARISVAVSVFRRPLAVLSVIDQRRDWCPTTGARWR
jgi:amidase